MEIAVADMADDRRDEPGSRDVALGLVDAFGEPRDRHADVGRERLRAGPQARAPPNRRRAAPARAGCAPPAWSPIRTARRRTRRRSRRSARPARRPRPRVPWNSTNSVGVSGSVELGIEVAARLTCTSSSSSMRATGMPDWMVTMAASQAASTEGNGQTPAEIASGMPCSFSVSSVMTPSVPSAPTNRRVRS